MPVLREVDLRVLPAPRRHPEVFGAFDALAPDQAFVVIDDHDQKPLLRAFQAERPGRFDWSVLEAGPERYRIEVRARAEPGTRTVTEYLQADHRRLDAIAARALELVAESAFQEAGARFADFECGLGHHIDVEEQVLFPDFERMTGLATGGPTSVMREEHVEIRALMAAVAAALAASDAAGVRVALQGLGQTLGVHNMKEEHVLYPMTDEMAGDERARDDLVKRLQAF